MSSCSLPHKSKMAAATPDLCPHSRQKEDGKAKRNASSALFKKSTLKSHPVLHLCLLDQKWVAWPSLLQSRKVSGEKVEINGVGPTSQQCLLQVGIHARTHSPQPPRYGHSQARNGLLLAVIQPTLMILVLRAAEPWSPVGNKLQSKARQKGGQEIEESPSRREGSAG